MNRNIDPEGPCSPSELRMLTELHQKAVQLSGRYEPPTVPLEFMLQLMADAKRESGRLINDLDKLERIARRHGQWPAVERMPPGTEMRPGHKSAIRPISEPAFGS